MRSITAESFLYCLEDPSRIWCRGVEELARCEFSESSRLTGLWFKISSQVRARKIYARSSSSCLCLKLASVVTNRNAWRKTTDCDDVINSSALWVPAREHGLERPTAGREPQTWLSLSTPRPSSPKWRRPSSSSPMTSETCSPWRRSTSAFRSAGSGPSGPPSSSTSCSGWWSSWK